MVGEKRLTPKQKREFRENAEKEHEHVKKARLLSRPEFNPSPRKIKDVPNAGKVPRATNNPDSIMSNFMVWCSSKADTIGEWSWGQPRQWKEKEWEELIHPKLCEFQRLTWAELFAQRTGGKERHKMHHDMDVCDIIPEAFDRWCETGLEEYDTAFRFKLGNKRRLWGYRIRANFYLVWWDPGHKIYPVEVQ